MVNNSIRALYALGQSVWCDNLSRDLIESGELTRLIDQGVVGVTSNPTIFMKAITGGSDYDRLFDQLLEEGRDLLSAYEGLVLPDVADAADLLRPVYDRTDGVDGYVSLEVNPKFAYDTEATLAEARRLFATLDRPNIMIKVPATDEGIPAVETLIAEGINVNVTLIFSQGMHERVMQAYVDGLKRLAAAGRDVSKVASVASFFVSRVDSMVDALLEEKRADGVAVDDLPGQAALANARLAYERFEQVFAKDGDFAELAAKGARVQRPLWASTSTKNPAYSPTKYVDGLVGPRTVNTLPPGSIEALQRSTVKGVAIHDDLPAARSALKQLERMGISMCAVTDKLRADGVGIFAKSFEDLLASLEEKRRALRATG